MSSKTMLALSRCLEDGGSSVSSTSTDEQTPLSPEAFEDHQRGSVSCMRMDGRPSMESMTRPAVEAAHGETAIVVCGGLSITAQARTYVAALSDERAVHKGSGAQGIFLFCEEFGW